MPYPTSTSHHSEGRVMSKLKELSDFLRCSLFGHDWDGCVCRRDGTVRNAEHDWDGCRCKKCQKFRDADHDWDGCVCRGCGTSKPNATETEHDWDGCVCRRRRCWGTRHD